MSTAGKVLVVLVTLSLLAWVVLFSAVAQLNTNWGQTIQKSEAQVADLATKQEVAEGQVQKNQVATHQKQRQEELELVTWRTRDAGAARVLSVANETNSRYKIDLQTVNAGAEEAKTAQDRWERDVADLKKQLAGVQGEVGRFKSENRILGDRLDKLEKEYTELAAQNLDAARKILRTSGPTPGTGAGR